MPYEVTIERYFSAEPEYLIPMSALNHSFKLLTSTATLGEAVRAAEEWRAANLPESDGWEHIDTWTYLNHERRVYRRVREWPTATHIADTVIEITRKEESNG